jgi:hypothetical protein
LFQISQMNIFSILPIEILALILTKCFGHGKLVWIDNRYHISQIESIQAFASVCKFSESYKIFFMQICSSKIYNRHYLAKLMLSTFENNQPKFVNSIVNQVLHYVDATKFDRFTIIKNSLKYRFELTAHMLFISAIDCKDNRQWTLSIRDYTNYKMAPSKIFSILNDVRLNKLKPDTKIIFTMSDVNIQIIIHRQAISSCSFEKPITVLDLIPCDNFVSSPINKCWDPIIGRIQKLFEQQISKSNIKFDPSYLDCHLEKFYWELTWMIP